MGLRLLPLVFSLILTVASRLLHPNSTYNKASRLMVKRFSTVKDTQRFTELHGEEKREEGDRDDQGRRGGIKRGESNIGSNQIPMCSPQPGTPREVHRVT